MRVRPFEVAREHSRDMPCIVERDVHDEVDTNHARDFRRFDMKRIAVESTFACAFVTEHRWAMHDAHRFDARHARADSLPAATEACHEMRLDQRCRDVQVGFDEFAVNPDRRSVGCLAHVGECRFVTRDVVDDADATHDLLADHVAKLVWRIRAMKTRTDDDHDAIVGDTCVIQRIEDRRG